MKSGKLESTAKWVVCVVGSLIMAGLCWYAFRYTQYMNIQSDEIPINVHDSMLRNILVLAAVLMLTVLLYLLERKGSKRLRAVLLYGTLALAMIWIGVAGIWWVTGLDRAPEGDQQYVYAAASYFIEDNYFLMNSYFEECPQNLGLTALIELLFRVVGTYNYHACQLIGVGMAVGIILLGFLIVRRLTDADGVAIGYNLFSMCCLPLIGYTNWVYGDIPSIFFLLTGFLALLCYEKAGKLRYLAVLVIAMTLAYLVRRNSVILIAALFLVGAVHVIVKRDFRLALALALTIILPVLVYSGITKMYEVRSGYPASKGMSYVSYVVMGLQENNGKYGWYTQYCRNVFHECGSDTELAGEVSKEDLKEILKNFAENPSYAVTFFRGKILSQWNMPTYQSLFFGYKLGKEAEMGPDDLAYLLITVYFTRILNFCDRLQMVVYAGMLLYFLLGVRKNGILHQLMAVGIIGGFLFSVIWEAKARYCLPYYIFMFPMAAIGWRLALEQVLQLFGRLRRGKQEDDNIIPFRRAA